jgi:hypothetical protein
MSISGLDLSAWITIYMGIMLLRASVPLSKADGTSNDSRRFISYVGYGLLVLGGVIFLLALRHR